jgi:prephenate dehydratase
MTNIAFQGELGAYSEIGVIEHFGAQAVPQPCESFEQVFLSVMSGACEYGFIPIENSLAGSIHQNYDLLLKYPLEVVGEHYLRIAHCLIGLPGVEKSEIRRVISHPQALAQCDGTLKKMPGVKIEAVYDTAGAVKLVKEWGDKNVAAIASRRAAETYHMQILAENIEDNPANFTRFLVIARHKVEPTDSAKTSIVFSLKHEPGTLFKALSVFALRNIDLTKIESRPLVGKPWEYVFYIDLAGSIEEVRIQKSLANLEEFAAFLRVLGSYPKF